MFSKALIAGGMILMIISCTSPEKLMNDKTADRIYFGKSGGFTNIPMEYVVIDNSRVYKIEEGKFSAIEKISRQQGGELDEMLEAIHIDQLNLNETGNITYYIKVVRPGSEKEIKWSDNTQNTEVKEFYKALMATVNK